MEGLVRPRDDVERPPGQAAPQREQPRPEPASPDPGTQAPAGEQAPLGTDDGAASSLWVQRPANRDAVSAQKSAGGEGQALRLSDEARSAASATEQPSLAEVRPVATHQRLRVLGIRIDNVDMDEAVATILERLDGGRPCQIAFVNAHCANVACGDAEYAEILRRTARNFPDGAGVRIAARWSGSSLRDNVNGTDLFPRLCAALSGTGRRVFLLGAKPGVADRVAAWMAAAWPDVGVAGYRDGYFTDDAAVADEIAGSGAHLLLVALGVPLQEKWIDRWLPATGCRVGIGVGALFDFYSDSVPRAPLWMRRHGLEWLYRLYQEPRRMWQRYVLGNPLFLLRVLLRR